MEPRKTRTKLEALLKQMGARSIISELAFSKSRPLRKSHLRFSNTAVKDYTMPKSKNLAEITFRQLSDRANLRGQIITKSYRSSKQTSNQDLGIWVLSLSLQISCPKHSFLLVK